MKHVVSVSLGSATRDHSVETEILGQKILIERIGTNGNLKKAIALISELDGKVDAFGMGGIDLYISAGKSRYILRDAKKIAQVAQQTPIVDGSGLKNTLEKKVIDYLQINSIINFRHKKVFMVCGVDRPGMAQAFSEAEAQLTFGDLIFGLGIPLALSLKSLERTARIIAPILSQVPFKLFYPTGAKQDVIIPKHKQYYLNNDIIAGDFLYIKRYMPEMLSGKIIITNTITEKDISVLREKGVNTLITTTPEFNGRSFGTNVMEAALVAVAGQGKRVLTPVEYSAMLDKIGFKPRILNLFSAQAIGG